MQQDKTVLRALAQCGLFGGFYGAACAGAWLEIMSIIGFIFPRPDNHDTVLTLIVLAVPVLLLGGFFGFLAGWIAGLIGGCLGGPLGWGIGGLVGSTVVTWWISGQHSLLVPMVIGPVVAFVLGWDVRRGTPASLFGRDLAAAVYESPLGGWLGWRKRLIAQ